MRRFVEAVTRTLMLTAALSGSVSGQAPLAKPEDLGLLLPLGLEAKVVEGRQVLLADGRSDQGEPLVGKVYLEVGDRYVVKLPNGTLRSVLQRDCVETDRPFQAASKDELAAELLQQFKGFKTRSTRRYFCVYNTSDSFCERMTSILETMYPKLEKYFQRQRLNVESLETPLVIVMFKNKKDFLRYRTMPQSLMAYYNIVDNRVFLYQHSDVEMAAPLIAAKQSISTIAHEGVHQILHNIGVQKRLSKWPIWISEGLAEYFAPTSTAARSKWNGVGKPNELRMRELFQYMQDRPGLGNGNLIKHMIATERLSSAEYAIAWSLTHYLTTKHRDEFFAYLREVSALDPLQATGDESSRFVRHFGEDFGKLEKEMITHIRSLPYTDPVLNQPYFLVAAISGRRSFATITTSPDYQKVKQGMLLKMSPAERVRARFLVRTFPNRKLAEQAMALLVR